MGRPGRVFLVTGCGAMHLNDSIGRGGLSYTCTHHEQAAAMAAEGYARIAGKPGILNCYDWTGQHQCCEWGFRRAAFRIRRMNGLRPITKAREMCGAPGTQKRIPQKRIEYLDALVRGYATVDMPEGNCLMDDDVYLAIPLQKGQLSCRELMRGEMLLNPLQKDPPIKIDGIESPYSHMPSSKKNYLSARD